MGFMRVRAAGQATRVYSGELNRTGVNCNPGFYVVPDWPGSVGSVALARSGLLYGTNHSSGSRYTSSGCGKPKLAAHGCI
jgi:hypothetical protein